MKGKPKQGKHRSHSSKIRRWERSKGYKESLEKRTEQLRKDLTR
jgi:hypothetical protein